jgi:hypothetical protein
MRYPRLKLAAVLLLVLGLTEVQAQATIPAAGGNASGSGGRVSYTVGQIGYTTHTGATGSVAQGVQQPYEISVETGLEYTKINLVVSAYPNPTTDYLILTVKDFELSTLPLSFSLYDINGKLLQTEKIEGSETSIVMSGLVSNIYLVKIVQGNKEAKTFKIIKN